MSFSSSSSCWQSPKTRKRKLNADSFSKRQRYRSKRIRNTVCMNEKYLEWNQLFQENFIKLEDDDKFSNSSFDVSSEVLFETNKLEPDYKFLSNKFKINLSIAKKYYSILINKPHVPIIRTEFIKHREPIINFTTSPVLSTKKKRKNLRIKYNSKRKTALGNFNNFQNYFETADELKIKQEIISDDSKSQDFHDNSPQDSKLSLSEDLQINPVKKWRELIDTSEDEFENLSINTNQSAVKQTLSSKNTKTIHFVTNPFSIKKNISSKRNVQSSKNVKKKSFWTKNFGDNNFLEKRKKFIETFEIKKKKGSKEHDNPNIIDLKDVSIINNNKNKEQKKTQNHTKKKKILKSENISDSDISMELSMDSLTVNFQPLSMLSNIEVENTTSSISSCIQNNIIKSFGEIPFQEDNDIKNDNDSKTNFQCDSQFAQQNVNEIDISRINIEEECNIFNDSFMSLDFIDSPPQVDSLSQIEKNVISSTTKTNSTQAVRTINKAKPIIISDDKLPSNSVVLPVLKNIKQLKLQPEVNKIENNRHLKSNDENSLPMLEEIPVSEIEGKSSLQDNQPINNNNAILDMEIDESFDSICESMTIYNGNQIESNNTNVDKMILSNNELPLLNNNVNEMHLVPKTVTVKKSSVNIQPLINRKLNFSPPKSSALQIKEQNDISTQRTTNLQSFEIRPSNSSIFIAKDLRFNRSLNPVKSANQQSFEIDSSKSIIFINKDPRLNRSSPVKSMNRQSSEITSNSTIFIDKDPRLNRSLSPVKSTNQQSSEIRPLNSPKFVNKDLRLNRSLNSVNSTNQQSSEIRPSNLSNFTNRDPRLNKSLSPINSTNHQSSEITPLNSPKFGNKDPKLNRPLSPEKSSHIDQKNPTLNLSNSSLKSPNIIQTQSSIDVNSKSDSSNVADISQSIVIVDPRLRKRKEREVEQEAKITENGVEDQNNEKLTAMISQEQSDSSQIVKKPKLSVFQRLGIKKLSKTPSPDRNAAPKPDSKVISNELSNLIKTNRNNRSISPEKNKSYRSDDELSLFANETFSSDEEANSSPPHRKFTQERIRNTEENKHQPISIKDRLNWKVPNNNYKMSSSINNTKTTSTMTTTTSNVTQTTTINNKNLITLKTSQSSVQLIPENKKPISTLSSNTPTPISFKYSNNEVFNEKFYKMNAAQMLRDVDNLRSQELESNDNTYITFGNDNTDTSNKFDNIWMLDGLSPPIQIGVQNDSKTNFFKNYCYRFLRRGKCLNEGTCHFSHQLLFLQKVIKQKKLELLIPILDVAIENNYEHFLITVWSSILPILQNNAFSVYEKLYEAHIRSRKIIQELLDFCLDSKVHTVESFVKQISSTIRNGDKEIVRIICTVIKNKLTDGFCWEAIKHLSKKATPTHDLIELSLLQCLNRKKNQVHLSEVYDLVKNKISPIERNKISQSLITRFFNFMQSKNLIGKEVLNTLPLTTTNVVNLTSSHKVASRDQSVESIESANNSESAPVKQLSTIIKIKKNNSIESSSKIKSPVATTTAGVQQPNNSPVEVKTASPNKGESKNFSEYIVNGVDSSEPMSSFRDRFWKLYVSVHNVKEGLKHIDYDFVWKVLDEFSKEKITDDLLRRAYYHILCKNVKRCESHISEIIKRAVRKRWSTSRKSINVLFDVGVCALIDLANNELWIMALQLLSSVKILEPDESRTAFILISAEIHLANNDPLETLYLLQRTRLIRTNRDEWLVNDSVKEDEKHRNRIVFNLLKALSYADPNKAVYLFKVLMDDQYISYYPIDLCLYLDKLMLLLLLNDEEELVSDICRIVIDNDLTFRKTTYQELIGYVLPFDDVLANQILSYAICLGHYTDIKIGYGFTNVIIDMNSYEEEVYLILKRLIDKLTFNIGPTASHLKAYQLKVFLAFEDVPADERLYRNEIAVIEENKYRIFTNLISTVLSTRFNPPIRISRKKATKFCKIVSRSLIEYFKYWS